MSQGKDLLNYYQQKGDDCYKERLSWLSKFDQCNSLLQEKQALMQKLKNQKDKQNDLHRGIVHHDVALLDQKLNVVKMHRENINNQYLDAEEVLKMEELMEQYPEQLQKHLPCSVVNNGGPIIDNELNIHAAGKKKKRGNFNIFRQHNAVLNSGKISEDPKIKYKPSKEQLLKRQINELKTNQNKQMCLLKEQKRKLEDLLKSVRQKQEETLDNQRDKMDKLKKEVKKQEQKHKQLAEKYFNTRKALKDQHQSTKVEHEKLKSTVASLEQKVNEQMRVYEKENKAKQTLIVRKSEDFQQDYKARMRAKERNLQALRDNYEKMQEVCIDKIKQLEETLTMAKHKLNETEQKRQYEITQLKSELFGLEKQVGEERAEKARIDEKMRNKIELDKRRRMELQEKEEEEKRKNEKSKKLLDAYKKPTRPATSNKARRQKQNRNTQKPKHPRAEQYSEEESEEESMNMSQLDNINQQIKKIGNKLDQKTK